jgi:hypothetical protein
LVFVVYLLLGPLQFVFYTKTYKEYRIPTFVFLSFDEPGAVYYIVDWTSGATVAINPFCCEVNARFFREWRLYRYDFVKNKSEFISVPPLYPSDVPDWRGDGDRNVLSNVFRGKFIYGVALNRGYKFGQEFDGQVLEDKALYYEIDMAHNERKTIFENLPGDLRVDGVRSLNNGLYLACAYNRRNVSHEEVVIVDAQGNVKKTINDACGGGIMLQYPDTTMVLNDLDHDTTHPTAYFIDNNATVHTGEPYKPYGPVTPDNDLQYWGIWDTNWLTFPTEIPLHISVLNRLSNEKREITLSREYLESVPGQPVFPKKSEAYWDYIRGGFQRAK